MGDFGEELLEKIFKVSYEEIRTLLLFQYLEETKNKDNSEKTPTDKVEYVDDLYRMISSLYSGRIRYRWSRIKRECCLDINRIDIEESLLDGKLYASKLLTTGLSLYYETLLSVACLFDICRNREDWVSISRNSEKPFLFNALLVTYSSTASNPDIVLDKKDALMLTEDTDYDTERLLRYLCYGVKDFRLFSSTLFLTMGLRMLMQSIVEKQFTNDADSIRYELASLCSNVLFFYNDYKKAFKFASMGIGSANPNYRTNSFDVLGSIAFDIKQYQLAYDVYSSWINTKLFPGLIEACHLSEQDIDSINSYLNSEEERKYRMQNKRETADMYSSLSCVCVDVMNLLKHSSERDNLYKIAHFCINKSIEIDPKKSDYLRIRGVILCKNNDYTEALKSFKLFYKRCSVTGDKVSILHQILLTYQNMNKKIPKYLFNKYADEFVRYYRRLLDFDYDNEVVQKGRDLYVLLTNCNKLSESNKGLKYTLFEVDRGIKDILEYLRRTPKFFSHFDVQIESFCEEVNDIVLKADYIDDTCDVADENDTSTIAYYTTLNNLKYLFADTEFSQRDENTERKESIKLNSLTMMHARYMNDPEEGLVLFQYLGKHFSKNPVELRDVLYDQKYVFLKSFTGLVDQLNMWTMYGSDREAGKDCNGCCVCLKPETFGPASNYQSKLDTKASAHSDDYNLYYVAYKDDNNIFYHKGKPDDVLTSMFENLNALLKNMKNNIKGATDEEREKDELVITDSLVRLLEKLVFLVKQVSYSQEAESRIILSRDINDRLDIRETKPSADYPNEPLKLYMNPPFQVYVDQIWLGPKLDNPDYWIPQLQYDLSKMHDKWVYGEERDYIPRVRLSKINIR